MGFTIAWILWIAAFLVIEGIALFRKEKGDTLSEHVWKWFGTRRDVEYEVDESGQPKGWLRFGRFVLLAFMAWLTAHFVTGGWV